MPKINFKTAAAENYEKAFSANTVVDIRPEVEKKNFVIPTGKGKLKFKSIIPQQAKEMDSGVGSITAIFHS
ncbi:hypothetical protein KUH03_02575 [Sphingobacterium sp. E70]|uniref:hypothetical protein n=1 Tax=Sphingobacterium sp. E70 TaxID=2853439 RepID=UPI00211CB0BA|nr:hypothetical protein [Sphingobacterium sp. E70]ULT25889.1 hypothetical protein KUH03_02575 [Sphingobacterium sp. E70]